MTETERHERLKALLAQREIAHYRGMPTTVASIDEQIAALVKDARPPARRAVTR